LLRSEDFVKVCVNDQQYMDRHRQIKLYCGSKCNFKSYVLQYSQAFTIFLASLEMFYLFPMWLRVENILMPVFQIKFL